MFHRSLLRTAMLLILGIATTSESFAGDRVDIQFNRDVRPILADNCFHCHGPDAATREAELRLDQRDDVVRVRGDHVVVAPREPSKSELLRRVMANDDDVRMPPHESGERLTANEVETLQRWINDGAEYQQHWAFTRPRRSSLPKIENALWPRNPIDWFTLAKIEGEALSPSPEANATTLVRRLSLDLTGLPPSLGDVDAFERDYARHPNAAYDRLVDRLLSSPRFGERWATNWLDAARYADTNGYFTDNDRTMWLWRDWVIEALNANMPFDQFTIEQLAGDLLKNPTIDQRVATGFNRNHMVNNETGIDEEEFRVEYVVDRVDTTSTVWMGLTLGCARCHDHKFDPISQKDFYRFFALFNNVPERGLSGSSGNSAPLLRISTPEHEARLRTIRAEVKAAEREFTDVEKQLEEGQRSWEKSVISTLSKPTAEGLVQHCSLDKIGASGLKSSMTSGTAVRTEAGVVGLAGKFAGDGCVTFDSGIDFERDDPFSFGAWVRPRGAGCVVSKIDDAADMRGFDLTLRKGKAIINLAHTWNRNAIQVVTTSSIPSGQWQHIMVTYDGSSKAAGVHVYVDGTRANVSVARDSLTASIRNDEMLRVGRRQASASFKGMIDDVRIYDRQLSAAEVHALATSQFIQYVVPLEPSKRSTPQKRKLRELYLREHADDSLNTAIKNLERLRTREHAMRKAVPTTMVMQEAAEPRPAFVLVRGEYNKPGEQVASGVPEFLLDAPVSDRLALAKWLVHPEHPLTARVAVNRMWQQLFGAGIVRTADDFGTQGEWPSHPQLLDWLAVELIESAWDVKHVLRLIVTSKTYRQSSAITSELQERDAENRLLARGPRFRMDAEMLRDNALALSGLLCEEFGGPSVKPYQPAGLWMDVTYDGDSAYQESQGTSLYRRSLYTFWKRQSPPPNMVVFDAQTRETCNVSRSRTNTPLQALVLMNDPTFIEASRKLAERTMSQGGKRLDSLAIFMFRTVTARRPTTAESKVLVDVFLGQRTSYSRERDKALKLLDVGASTFDEKLDAVELAAWTTVASMILSLDEAITRQ